MKKAIVLITVLFMLGCGSRTYDNLYDCSMRSDEFREKKLWECRTTSEAPGYCYGYYVQTFCAAREETK